ncbi:MAG TPA: hypothetical protein VNL37_03030 [Candidatus Polarisedimenticolia bacterium]|nr:hypothetical protein [Candidatus Polarisedimenticolia bacterium]
MIVPFVKPPAVVIVYLQEPRERFWGLVRHLDSSGIVVQGIDLDSFDDWVRHIVERGEAPHLSTVFFPLPRVEKVLVDATSGPVPSLAEQFERRVGRSLQEFLDSHE